MAEQKFQVNCGFFNSINKDRTYNAEHMNRPYKRIVGNGVFATQQGTPSTDLQVLSANRGMNIIVKKGEGIFANKWFENPSDILITVPSNTVVVPRIDSVIAQVDNTQNGRAGNIIYRTGIPSSEPAPPDINIDENVVEYRIANVYVSSSAVDIEQDVITDLRGSSECLWVTSLINQVDTSALFTQYETAYKKFFETEKEAFEAFMNNITSELGVSTNIIQYETHYLTTEEVNEIPINVVTFNQYKDILMVFVNRWRAVFGVDYTISEDGTKIILTNSLLEGQNVDFLVLQSVVAADVESIAMEFQKLNNILIELNSDTGWYELSLENGASNFEDTSKLSVRKLGNEVFIEGAIKGITELNTTICTLPESFRPSKNHIFGTNFDDNGSLVSNSIVKVDTDGTITIISKNGTISADNMLNLTTNFVRG